MGICWGEVEDVYVVVYDDNDMCLRLFNLFVWDFVDRVGIFVSKVIVGNIDEYREFFIYWF